jgi:hypothetical protein
MTDIRYGVVDVGGTQIGDEAGSLGAGFLALDRRQHRTR